MVHRAVMLVLLEVSMSTELNMRSSRRVCVVGTSTCKYTHTETNIEPYCNNHTGLHAAYT